MDKITDNIATKKNVSIWNDQHLLFNIFDYTKIRDELNTNIHIKYIDESF